METACSEILLFHLILKEIVYLQGFKLMIILMNISVRLINIIQLIDWCAKSDIRVFSHIVDKAYCDKNDNRILKP